MKKEYDIFGLGNILVDYVAEINEDILKQFNLTKNIMNIKSIKDIKNLETKLKNIKKYPGGSVSNVAHGISNLNLKAALAGSVAKDEDGKLFVNELEKIGTKSCVVYKKGNTGIAISLVTSDGERTFVVNYGVAEDYNPKDIDQETLMKSKYLHFTGYEFELRNRTIKKAVKIAKQHDTRISFDLGDPNVVLRNKRKLQYFLKKVDVVFANEEEAKNFTGKQDPEKALEKLANYCEIAVVKIGKEGSLVKSGNTVHKVKGYKVKLVNTIGAGDGFAAGFLYGLCKDYDLEYSCKLGNFYASRIVRETGARLGYKMGWEIFSRPDLYG